MKKQPPIDDDYLQEYYERFVLGSSPAPDRLQWQNVGEEMKDSVRNSIGYAGFKLSKAWGNFTKALGL